MASIWGDTSQLGAVAGAQTMPVAGKYGYLSGFSNLAADPALKEMDPKTKEFALMFGAIGLQNDLAAQRSADTMDKLLAYQERASQKANEMGIRNQVIGSFLKDVPAAFGAAANARNQFLPQQVQIAANSMQTGNAPYTPRNYYGFVG
jgi:hypothetical protein